MAKVVEVENAGPILTPEVPVMTGTHFHALDEKGRVIIPAKLRPALTEQFWMMLDPNDNISIYNYRTGLDVLEHCERMIADHPEDEDIAAAVERITGAAELMTVEGGWRVPVPEILRFYGQFDREVVTVGVLNHAVLWAREKWEESQTQRLQSPDVRRAQAGMLRTAASSLRKSVNIPVENEEYVETTQIAAATGTEGNYGFGGRAGAARGTGGSNTANPPASNGGRSPRILTMSKLGR
jgi:MraZ protein